MKAIVRKTDIPTVTVRAIRDHVDERSFDRGQGYYHDRAIFDAMRCGNVLRASCRGSSAESYDLRATLTGKGITKTDCSCPVGDGGRCKHVAALLLTWVNTPETFAEVEPVDTSLERRDKAQLIALIRQMLAQEPSLESLLARPLPGDAAAGNAESYRRQASRMLRDEGRWDDTRQSARRLGALLRSGEAFIESADMSSAAAVYAGVADAVLEKFEQFDDSNGDLIGLLSECGDGVAECFMRMSPGSDRTRVLAALWRLIQGDVALGGLDFSNEAEDAILQRATDAEKKTVEGWARKAMVGGDGWKRETYGALVLALMTDAESTEEAISVCRETGMADKLIPRLVERSRMDEALAALETVESYRLLELAKLFKEPKHAAMFEEQVRLRANQPGGYAFWDWLRSRCAKRGDNKGALHWAELRFREFPSLEAIAGLEEYAAPLGWWEKQVYPRTLQFLQDTGRFDLLVEIALSDGDIERALEIISAKRKPGQWLHDDTLLKVAKAAEGSRPLRAIEIYQAQVEKCIELQGRDNYAKGCTLLTSIAKLMRTTGLATQWETYFGTLRVRHNAKRNLKEEMVKAGL